MLKMIKRLLPAEPLPAHLHFHLDETGNRIICDESVCRPHDHSTTLLFLPFR